MDRLVVTRAFVTTVEHGSLTNAAAGPLKPCR